MEQYHHGKRNEKLLNVRQFVAVGFSCLTHYKQLQTFILHPALCTSLVFWLHPKVNVCFRLALQYFGSPNLSEAHYFLNCITAPTNISLNSISFQEICFISFHLISTRIRNLIGDISIIVATKRKVPGSKPPLLAGGEIFRIRPERS
jgi:hypothetical protein